MKPQNKLLVATRNKGKAKEFEGILKTPLEIVDVFIDEVQSMDLEYVSRKKTEEAYKILKKPLITDDVGVFIKAWNGFPGPFAKFILNSLGNKKILSLLKNEKDRSVIVKSAVGYHDGKKVHVFTGGIKGTLAFKEKGVEGYGFDPIVIPNGQTQTFAQMGPKRKNMLSHRRKALDKLKKFLDSQKN